MILRFELDSKNGFKDTFLSVMAKMNTEIIRKEFDSWRTTLSKLHGKSLRNRVQIQQIGTMQDGQAIHIIQQSHNTKTVDTINPKKFQVQNFSSSSIHFTYFSKFYIILERGK